MIIPRIREKNNSVINPKQALKTCLLKAMNKVKIIQGNNKINNRGKTKTMGFLNLNLNTKNFQI